MRRKRFHLIATGGVLACLIALYGAFAAPASAAPQYQDSEPNDGASLATAPAAVSITFSEPLDDSSTMTVANECGADVDADDVSVSVNEMSVDVSEGHYSGTYRVSFQAVGVGGVTGTRNGVFTFDVAEGHACRGGDDHGGHGGHDGGDKGHGDHNKDDGHGNHDGGDDHDDHGSAGHNGSDHDSMDHGAGGHSTMGHGTDGHSAHGSGGTTHGTEHSDHGEGGEHGDDHGRHEASAGGTLASKPLPALPADGQAVLIALTLCAVMGVIGGVFLRTAGN
jgi:methionine-rich copper-binding protein CopC